MNRLKVLRKLATTWSRDNEVLIPAQYNIISLIGLLHDIISMGIRGCTQIKVLKKPGRLEVSNSQETQNTKTINETCSIGDSIKVFHLTGSHFLRVALLEM